MKQVLNTLRKLRMPSVRSRQTSYEQRIANEIHTYSEVFRKAGGSNSADGDLQRYSWKVSAFEYATKLYSPYVSARMPRVAMDPVVNARLASSAPVSILSLGCATGDWELKFAKAAPDRCSVTLVDLNPELLEEAAAYARKHNLQLTTHAADVNQFRIPPESFDFIVCRSSLHHFMKLEFVLSQIHSGLKRDGNLLVIGEWIGRNGLQIYPETELAANDIFRRLPARLRRNSYTDCIDEKVPNIDHSINCFEAVRSEDIFPMLLSTFRAEEYVAYDAMMSLLFDFRYGSNYNLEIGGDRQVIETTIAKDIEFLQKKVLRPTALFGIFARK